MKIAVVGVGAVGGYFGGRLAAAGEEVTFLARGRTLTSLRRHGLRLRSIKGDVHLTNLRASGEPEQVGPVDVVILGVKAWQVAEVARTIGPLVGEATAILPLQNGVDVADQLAEVHGREHVLGGMCRIVALQAAPGQIHHVAVEPFVALGELDNDPSVRARELVATFLRAGVEAELAADIHSRIWQKFMFIAPVSGIGAVTRMPIGITRAVAQTRAALVRATQEVHAVATRRGIRLPAEAVAKTMEFVDGMAAEATASMQRDIAAGLPSELEAINGAVVRLGSACGVSVPTNEFIYAALLPLELQARAGGRETRG